jgi:hypothetical protein
MTYIREAGVPWRVSFVAFMGIEDRGTIDQAVNRWRLVSGLLGLIVDNVDV